MRVPCMHERHNRGGHDANVRAGREEHEEYGQGMADREGETESEGVEWRGREAWRLILLTALVCLLHRVWQTQVCHCDAGDGKDRGHPW